MKRLTIGLMLGLAVCTLSADDEGAALEEKAKRLMGLVGELDSDRPDVREDAATKLLAAGGDAIPFVIDGVYRKNAKLHLQVLEKLLVQEKKGLPAELQLTDQDLKEIVKHRLGDAKLTAPARTWLYGKYIEAVDLYRKGRYEEALAKTAAILELDPRIEFGDDLRKLRIKCEEKQVQVGLVRTAATTLTPICQDNSIAKIAFNATNLAAGEVEIWFGAPTDAKDSDVVAAVKKQAMLHVEVVKQICEPDGSFRQESESLLKPLDRYSIPLKLGESKRLYEMELPAMAPGPEMVKFIIFAKMRVVKIDGPEPMEKERWIEFAPVEIRVIPGNIQAAGGNALQDLLTAIDKRQPDSVFLFCNIMPEKDRPLAAEALIKVLKTSSATEYDRAVARNCLGTLTGEFHASDEGWLKWHEDTNAVVAPNRTEK
ncbi:MAG: hypothetical protein AAB074_20950 [Planctomycetota bacterium]